MSLCPASFVTIATSLTSPLTRSHASRGRRTCWSVHTRSSPTSTSPHGKNQTQVKWKGKRRYILNHKSLHILYCLFLLPYLSYCVEEVWGNLHKINLHPLCVLQKKEPYGLINVGFCGSRRNTKTDISLRYKNEEGQ